MGASAKRGGDGAYARRARPGTVMGRGGKLPRVDQGISRGLHSSGLGECMEVHHIPRLRVDGSLLWHIRENAEVPRRSIGKPGHSNQSAKRREKV